MGETPSCKQWLEKRTVQCTSTLYWGPDTSPAPALHPGQCGRCQVSPWSDPHIPLLEVCTPFSLFSPPASPGFIPSSHAMQLRAEQRTAHPFSSGSPNPRPHGHPWEHTPSPASLCPAPCRRSQAPPSAEPPSSSTSHT